MDLKALGYNDWFSSCATTVLQEGHSVARVMAVDRGAFVIRDERNETVAELSGKFRFTMEANTDLPCVGDWVCVDHAPATHAIIHAVLPRSTFLRRTSGIWLWYPIIFSAGFFWGYSDSSWAVSRPACAAKAKA